MVAPQATTSPTGFCDPDCKRCMLHASTVRVCISGRGPVPADILMIGEAPGAYEEKEGQAFVGPAGKILDELTLEANLGDYIRISNPCRCRPPGNRKPTNEELEACRIFLGQELEAVQPKLIVALGTTAAHVLTGKSVIKSSRSQLLPALPHWRTKASVLITYHPAAMLHQDSRGGSQIRAAILSDLKLAKATVYGGSSSHIQVGHPYTQEGTRLVEKFDRIVHSDRTLELICDLEWEVSKNENTGKARFWPWASSGQIISIGLAVREGSEILSISVPWEAAWTPLIQESLQHPLIYHNAIADLIWLLGRYGDVGPPVGDSLVLASLLGYSGLGLKVLAPQVCSVKPGWGEGVPLGVRPTTIADWRKLLRYNALDAAHTLMLHAALVDQMYQTRPQIEALYRHLLLPATYHMARGGLIGLPMDLPKLKAMESEVGQLIVQRSSELEQALGVPMRSKVKVAEAVERITGATLGRTPKLNHPRLTNLDLEQINHPVTKALVGLAKMVKLRSTYLKPWAAMMSDMEDPRLHTVYRVTGTVTGRTSAEAEAGGTVQQYPRGGKMRSIVRARPGWLILNADHSMAELRVAAWLSRESRMLRFFQEGVDLHKATAAWIMTRSLGVLLDDFVRDILTHTSTISKDQRQNAKPVNFGLLYGGRENVVIDTARKDYGIIMSLEQATLARKGYFELYPGLIPWHASAWASVRKGYIETPFGLVRSLAGINEDPNALHRKAVNTPVQGTASYIALLGLVECCNEIKRRGLQEVIHITDFVHDNILGEVREDYAGEARELIKEQLEHPPLHLFGIDMDVPLVADITIAESWG